ncbi:3-keto-5-aminohexanoate cleavage protein [Streptomyces sp. M19]
MSSSTSRPGWAGTSSSTPRTRSPTSPAPTWSAAWSGCRTSRTCSPTSAPWTAARSTSATAATCTSPPRHAARGRKRIQELGVRPELEIFDTGQLWFAKQLLAEGCSTTRRSSSCAWASLGAPAEPGVLKAMVDILPEGAQWASFALGRMQMPWVAQSILLGGNVRVGLEDNLYLSKGVKATNAQLVERAVRIVESLGASVATPDEARQRLSLKPRP